MKTKDINKNLDLKHNSNGKSPLIENLNKILRSKYLIYAVFFIILLLFQLGRGSVISGYIMNQITLMLIYFIAILGFNLLMGYSGLSSLGTSGFIGLGSFVTAILVGQKNLPLIVAFIVVILVSIIVGVMVGFVSLRIDGIYLAIVTLGLSEILYRFFIEIVTEVADGLDFIRVATRNLTPFMGFITHSNMTIYLLIILAVIIITLITTNIMISPLGRAFLSMKNSTSAAQAMGIGLLRHRLLAFVISTVFAGIAGFFHSIFMQKWAPADWDIMLSLNILAAVVIGGSKSVWASLGGTVIIFGSQPFLFDRIQKALGIPSEYNISNILSGVLIILIVMFFSGGLIQIFGIIKNKIKNQYNLTKEKKWRKRYGENSNYQCTQEEFIIKQHQKVNQ